MNQKQSESIRQISLINYRLLMNIYQRRPEGSSITEAEIKALDREFRNLDVKGTYFKHRFDEQSADPDFISFISNLADNADSKGATELARKFRSLIGNGGLQGSKPVCGNGKIEGTEECDKGSPNGAGEVMPGIVCTDECALALDGVETSEPDCGNGIIEGTEQCDMGYPNKVPHNGAGEVMSGIVCTELCELQVATPAAECGNGIMEEYEECELGIPLPPDAVCDIQCKIVFTGPGGGGSSAQQCATSLSSINAPVVFAKLVYVDSNPVKVETTVATLCNTENRVELITCGDGIISGDEQCEFFKPETSQTRFPGDQETSLEAKLANTNPLPEGATCNECMVVCAGESMIYNLENFGCDTVTGPIEPGSLCGNGAIDEGEECDSNQLAGGGGMTEMDATCVYCRVECTGEGMTYNPGTYECIENV